MPKMVSMKTVWDGMSAMPMQESHYTYGTCLMLNEDQCEALGIGRAPVPGTIVNIRAVAFVKRSGSSLDMDEGSKSDGPEITVDLQIAEMSAELTSRKAPEEMLYGKAED